jgi:hypothetical protein
MDQKVKEAWQRIKERMYVSAKEMHEISPKYHNTPTDQSLTAFTIDHLEEVRLIEEVLKKADLI